MMSLVCLQRFASVIRSVRPTRHSFRSLRTSVYYMNKSKVGNKGGAIPFSDSKAASWNATNTFASPPKDVPSYQPIAVCLSVGVFLLYFLFLRKENDLDIELNRTLYERVPGLEESQVKATIKYNKDRAIDTADLEKRLAVIQKDQTTAKND